MSGNELSRSTYREQSEGEDNLGRLSPAMTMGAIQTRKWQDEYSSPYESYSRHSQTRDDTVCVKIYNVIVSFLSNGETSTLR